MQKTSSRYYLRFFNKLLLILIAAQVGNAVHAGTGGLAEHHKLIIVLDICHQPDILRHIEIGSEALKFFALILCFLPRNEIVLPQLGATLHLCKMSLDIHEIAMHIVVCLEALFFCNSCGIYSCRPIVFGFGSD